MDVQSVKNRRRGKIKISGKYICKISRTGFSRASRAPADYRFSASELERETG